MKQFVVRSLIILPLLIPLSSCPGSAGPALGLWLFTVAPDGGQATNPVLIIQANGATMDPMPLPPQSSSTFNGVVTWTQTGSTIELLQSTTSATKFLHTGELYSTSFMGGTYTQTVGGNATGVWSAIFLQ